MNIFKTLASGSGSINEPNVSAFLGYLLNPKEDHGLGDAFLKRFLDPLLINNDKLKLRERNLSIHSNFEIEVLLEQAFRDINKSTSQKGKQIVDIVILCYEKESQQGSTLAKNIIQQKQGGESKAKLKQIFLIENKISGGSVTEGQLEKQFDNTIAELGGLRIENPRELVSVIFVTPDDTECGNEFLKLDDTINKIHLLWRIKNNNSTSRNDNTSISKMITEIIQKETKPIDVYCKHTLQAFLEFIENDFKSAIIEESEEKKKESPRFEYKGEKLSRPRLAQRLISDYVKKYEENNKEKITFEELRMALFPKKKWNPTTFPFTKEEYAKKADFRKDGTIIYDNYGYYPDLLEIKDAKIRFGTGFSDENELQNLLDKTVGGKLDDMRKS